MDELDDMLAEDAMNEMPDVPVSNVPINPNKIKPQPAAAKPAAQQISADEDAELEAMMAL